MTPLIDSFGRIATDLRVSLTDRCNLRCTYCMPAEGLDWLRSDALLTAEEYIRLIGIAVTELGIRSVRFTGGEPLIYKDLERIITAVAALSPRPDIALTTNGIGLDRKAATLRDAGLDRINVSLDTLDADRFAAITRRDRLTDVLAGLEAASAAGLTPTKINAVLTPEQYKEDSVELLRFSLERGFELRIIEQMPLDAGHHWNRAHMVTADEVHAALSREFTLSADPAPRGSAPAQRWLVNGGPATVGIIASVSRPFCGDCDRTRLTADGQVRNCLFATTETDLRGLLRSGADDDVVASAWQAAMWGKKPGHGINDPSFLQPDRPMSAIGG
ncbi:GTP 3',8-cyclase MoaA [Mycobacteroides chelonae]|jgi:cyclic pyranopterin phosphate synthase|uniref:GTP 3',8-cyclase n=1 Tax=Mycobacteroides chelonae TaxID=1774 RepID=A0A1S1M6G0_MYCCH|nr:MULTISPECIES: GTP 3',8-cyclase MoaA [Mycobacteroides]KRQ17903.1 cyclic pyranopterin phosphate synthase MoaA [Mycobacteroides sp. H072]KRQ29714.1 cyclic pyranopterin phosphate synthase MoaA [Mycobacteroides sp. H002]KRQ44848.1 cyclic pyranopterin phosphate synthase MoaA [Mycobacteroides sp. H054]KRQ68845.1 cyclic pyranopterin phosphate synthase MoaA [Mycobacteroides sp. H001]MBF9350582.1 GTP 3',8-cyclase MoaA [Mycobacteroides chelonae]